MTTFDKRLFIEQVRYIEAEQTLACDAKDTPPEPSAHSDFEHRLWQRARRLVDCNNLSAPSQAAKLSRFANTAALMIAATLGALGVNYAITGDDTINIYWLLLVLLGFNFLSMLLWLVGISLNMSGLTTSVLARLVSNLPTHFKNKHNPARSQADRAWLACQFTGGVGKWQFSKITHQLWLAYLLSGLMMLVLLLMVQQYEFVWGTTLLSDSAFTHLTATLSVPLQTLGFATPSAEQVMETRIGIAQALTAEHRNHWAQFLLGALLCFGIAPRAILWAWAALMSAHARRQFKLDYYLPYYIHLHQQLMPLASHGQIIDADIAPPIISPGEIPPPAAQPLPDKAAWVAVELERNTRWPLADIPAENNLGHVIDSNSLATIVQHLQSNRCTVIAVAVSATRHPDRGVQRAITSLMSHCEQCWLVLLQNPEAQAVTNTRLAAWYRLAETCQVPLDHVITIRPI